MFINFFEVIIVQNDRRNIYIYIYSMMFYIPLHYSLHLILNRIMFDVTYIPFTYYSYFVDSF